LIKNKTVNEKAPPFFFGGGFLKNGGGGGGNKKKAPHLFIFPCCKSFTKLYK